MFSYKKYAIIYMYIYFVSITIYDGVFVVFRIIKNDNMLSLETNWPSNKKELYNNCNITNDRKKAG